MSFVSGFLLLIQNVAGTARDRLALLPVDRFNARGEKSACIEKNIDRTGGAFRDAAQLLERCLPSSFGM